MTKPSRGGPAERPAAPPAAPPRARGVTGELGLVMSGGGARAAYQAGFLRAVARKFPELRVEILTGVSAGAINAAFLAARPGTFAERVAALVDTWRSLGMDDVFHVDPASLARNVAVWGMRLISGGGVAAPRVRGFVETSPLRALLARELGAPGGGDIPGVARALESGDLKAVAVSAVSYSTGQSVTWVQGRDIEAWDRPNRKSVNCTLGVGHVMASSALPLFFPAVQVDGQWYGDGGVRMTSPLAPALHLGARRIVAISVRRARTRAEADQPTVLGYPPPAQVGGILMNAIFLDLIDQDAVTLERFNRMVEHVPDENRGGLRVIDLLVLRPSRDLGRLANEYEPKLPRSFRFLSRGLGTRETRSNDLLSLVMFQEDYLRSLLEIGEEDAEKRLDEIGAFLAPNI